MAFLPVSAAILPTADARNLALLRASVAGLQQPDIRKADRPKSVSPTLEHPLHEPSIDACARQRQKLHAIAISLPRHYLKASNAGFSIL